MVRLELTLAEAQHLHHWLMDTLDRSSAQPGAITCLQTVGAKLAAAVNDATQRQQCPVCQHWFTQENKGRNGRYCGAACKQKAYRQRRLDARKQFRPSAKR